MLTTIGLQAFQQTGLTSIAFPASVTEIGSNAFYNASALAELAFLSDAAPTVGDNAFTGVASSAKAIIKTGATGFTATGNPARWNGIAVEEYQGGYPTYVLAKAEQARLAAIAEQARLAALAEQARLAALAEQARLAAVAAAELASRTVSAKNSFSGKSLAQRTGVQVVSPMAGVTFAIAGGSKKVCTKSGSKIKTVAAGNCVVTFTVQEPTPAGQKLSKSLVVGEIGSSSSWKAKTNYSISAVASGSDVVRSSSAKLSMTVAKSSKSICSKSGSNLKMLKAGTCNVTFTVQEPKPAATKTSKTFVVN
jgi:hypothetical protein